MSTQERQILAKQCVKCAICLPHCPTYAVSLDENESPRGRIALMQGLAEGNLVPSLKLANHLDNCLQCGSCTAVCPADVQYDQLITHTHHDVPESITPRVKRIGRLAHTILKSPMRTRWSLRFLQLLQKCNISFLGRKLPPIHLVKKFKTTHHSTQLQKRISLLTGCAGNGFDTKTIQDTVFVLNALGFSVSIPEEQRCCGSIAYHHGLFKENDALLNDQACLGMDPDIHTIISLASGCSAHLYEMKALDQYPWLSRVQDIHDFLAGIDFSLYPLRPISGEYKLHIPCTVRNELKQRQKLIDIYKAIPDLHLEIIEAPNRCCGAAGLYMLEHPTTANTLGYSVLNAAGHEGDIVSSGIGCRLHLQGLQPKRCFLHPISLLALSLGLPN